VHTSYIIEPSRQRPEQIPIAQSDRDALKANILSLLAASPSRAITAQLAATLKDLIVNDFPEKWSNLLQNVNQLLKSASKQEVGAGCVAALECVRAFRQVLYHRACACAAPNGMTDIDVSITRQVPPKERHPPWCC